METIIFVGKVISIMQTQNRAIIGFPMEQDPKRMIHIEIVSVVKQSNLYPISSSLTLGIHNIHKGFNLDEDEIINKVFEFKYSIPSNYDRINSQIENLEIKLRNE